MTVTVNRGGRPRQFAPGVVEVNLTARQRVALARMVAETGRGWSALVREAVEAYLVTNGYLNPFPTSERNSSE